ncbi:MAG TPA: DUF3300 domain-containing protein [Stellaceae bacterium]|nr:DUF3300 domain-containing protein [Stellaceae bacterium]
MQHRLIGAFTAVAIALTAPAALQAQYAPPPPNQPPPPPDQSQVAPPPNQPAPAQAAAVYDQGQLDQLLAPIALYPDQLLGQILMASTYPLEVVEAARWLQEPNNAVLGGEALAQAVDQQDWDPSVKSLVPFPSVLQMMNDQLQWTQRLGDAFLAQQADVMESVQRLRHEALNNGRLQSTPQMIVGTDGPDIVIQPADPNMVYVPYYDPSAVYGAWAYPDDPPYYFAPPPGYVYGPVVAGIGFGVGYGVFGPFWGWDDFDWRRHRVHIDRDRFREMDRLHRETMDGDTWQHDPEHRRGVAYRDPASQQRFTRANVGPQDMNRTTPGVTSRGVLPPTQPGTTGQPGTTVQRFQRTQQTNVAPGATPHAPTILRGSGASQPPPAGSQVVPQGQGVAPRLRGQMGNQTVVPQGHVVTPQVQQAQPRVVTPPPPQNRGVEQDRRLPGGGNGN